ncbi:hypothetical protein D3C73_1299110 [compost metagenome]
MGDRGNKVILNLIAADNLIRHIVQGRGQIADLVFVITFDTCGELALGHLGRDRRDIIQRLNDRIRQTEAEQHNDHHNRHTDPDGRQSKIEQILIDPLHRGQIPDHIFIPAVDLD